MEAICSSETSVETQQTTQHHIPPLWKPQILYESYTLKQVFIYITHVKSEEKILA
jgi:hypothetical protein